MPEDPPEQLAAVDAPVVANDDQYILNARSMLLPVLDNDDGNELQLIALEAPDGMTVEVEDNQLRVIMENAGTHVLSYRITDGSSNSTATVTVVNLGSEILADELAFVEAEGRQLSAAEAAANNESADATVWQKIAPVVVPPGLRSLADLELPLLGFSYVGLPVLLSMLGFYLLSRRRRYVLVEGVERSTSLAANGSDRDFRLRHDATGLWSTGHRRGGKIQVQTPNGNRWVAKQKVDPGLS